METEKNTERDIGRCLAKCLRKCGQVTEESFYTQCILEMIIWIIVYFELT